MKAYQPSKNCIALVKQFEGLYLNAYLCPACVWTIGWGTTVYPGGKLVKQGDVCDKEEAMHWLLYELNVKAAAIAPFIRSKINQSQFDALLSFAYNMGVSALKNSTLLKKVNANPHDETIRDEFNRWVFGGNGEHNNIDDDGDGLIDEKGEKKKLAGLVKREAAQAALYFQ